MTRTEAAAPASDAAALLDGYGRMLLLRRFEEAMQRLFLRNEIHGTVHLYIGQEAVSVGVCSALREDDLVAATYRGHGAALAKGTDPEALAAELMGRATGACGGRAGSMNVVDLEHGLIGCFGIVGGSIAAATGAGITAARDGRVVVAFFGDGAANQGYFQECLNFAQVMGLPVLYVCENNGYGEFTPTELVTAGGDIGARAAVLRIPAQRIDGNDLEAVATAAREAVERARAGKGPSFIEAVTYRQVGHSKSDPGAYRPEGELDWWLARDPLSLLRGRLTGELGVGEERVAEVERAADERIENAVEAALAGPYPDPEVEAAREYAP
jgi:TPP-dependent pyruvate/acetoin dehydrogenase alpha subunit